MKKNILFIESGQYGGGSFNALLYVLKFINRDKYEPFVLYFNKSKYYKKTLNLNIKTFLFSDIVYSLDSNIIILKFLNYINLFLSKKIPSISIFFDKIIHYKTINYINNIIKKNNIHLIHCNVQIARDLFITFCALKNKIHIVNFIRSPKIDVMNDYKSNFINQYNNKIIAVSKSIKELWKEEGIKNSKFAVIYDGIDTTVLKRIDFYNELNLKENNDYYFIGCVGRFVKGKGQMILINAFEKLINNNTKKFKLILLGDGPNMKSLQNYVENNGLSNEIFFLGYKDNAIDYINSFDLLVLPSSIDVCSNVLLESLYEILYA